MNSAISRLKIMVTCGRKYWSKTSLQYIRCGNLRHREWKYCIECMENSYFKNSKKERSDVGRSHAPRYKQRFYQHVTNKDIYLDLTA